MVEPGRSAAKKTTASTSTTRKKKLTAATKPDKEKPAADGKKQNSAAGAEPAAAESPSYRLALRSLFSCRNSHAALHHRVTAPPPAEDAPTAARNCKKNKQPPLGCSSASICKLRDASPRRVVLQRRPEDAAPAAAEPCKRRASVSGVGGSERRVKKQPLQQRSEATGVGHSSRHWGSSTSSSSSTAGGSSFRLRRLSGCYECHMVDPVSGSSMRAAIFPCPDCGDVFVRAESLHIHQSTRHAVSELAGDDTSRNIIEIIFQSSWLKKQTPVCAVDRILKVHNAPAVLARFEAYRDAVKAKAVRLAGAAGAGARCTADGNELLRFHCAPLACPLGAQGATHLCDAAACAACGIVRDGFGFAKGAGVRTMATSGRAHDAVEGGGGERRAMLVCRVIAGRVKRAAPPAPCQETTAEETEEDASSEEYDSVAGTAGVYSSLDELEVFNPRAILPCFVVVYKA